MGPSQSGKNINNALVCLFHSTVDPTWFTEATPDEIPVCTKCNLHLIPRSMKHALVTGVLQPSLKLDSATSRMAAFTALTMLWSCINSTDSPIFATSPVAWKAWNPEDYIDWPLIGQSAFLNTFREGRFLSSAELGSLTEHMECLASVSANLSWRLQGSSKKKTVTLWPKRSLATLSSKNYKAFLEYLAIARESISNEPVWSLVDRLIELLSKNPPRANSMSLFGADVVLHTMRSLRLQESRELMGGAEFKSTDILELQPESNIDPYGPESPKRIFQLFSAEAEMLGPFDLSVGVVSANIDAGKLTLVHSYKFKMLVGATDAESAITQIKQNFFDNYGLTLMRRENQNWLVNKKQGVDWEQFGSKSVRESSLFSKIVDVKLSDDHDWKETTWGSRIQILVMTHTQSMAT